MQKSLHFSSADTNLLPRPEFCKENDQSNEIVNDTASRNSIKRKLDHNDTKKCHDDDFLSLFDGDNSILNNSKSCENLEQVDALINQLKFSDNSDGLNNNSMQFITKDIHDQNEIYTKPTLDDSNSVSSWSCALKGNNVNTSLGTSWNGRLNEAEVAVQSIIDSNDQDIDEDILNPTCSMDMQMHCAIESIMMPSPKLGHSYAITKSNNIESMSSRQQLVLASSSHLSSMRPSHQTMPFQSTAVNDSMLDEAVKSILT